MCQLLGISSNHEVNMDFSFREWRHRGADNPHGYGFASWHGGRLDILKSTASLHEQADGVGEQISTIRSHIFIGHVRLASVGSKDGKNTHPFRAKSGGREFVFAHNGTVSSVKSWPLKSMIPEGQTDSEHAFLWLLEQMAGVAAAQWPRALKKHADKVREHGRFNFLLSDGQTLYAYADNALHYIERKPPYGGELVQLKDDGYSISLQEVKGGDERAVLVATEPLSDEKGWRRLPAGTMLVIRDGAVAAKVG